MRKNEVIRIILFVIIIFSLNSCRSTKSIISSKDETEVTTGVVASVTIDSTKTINEEKSVVSTAREVIEKSTVIIKVADGNGELKTIREEEHTNQKLEKFDSTCLYKSLYEDAIRQMDSLLIESKFHNEQEYKEKKKQRYPFDWLEISFLIALAIIAGFIYIRLDRR